MISTLFNLIIFKPILNLLILIYSLVGDFGITIIIITLLLKLVLFPLNKKSYQNQKNFAKVQPRIKALQEKHKDDKQKLMTETMAVYKELKVNPLGFFVPFLVQIVILIALYRVIFMAVNNGFQDYLYFFIPQVHKISLTIFNIFDLSKPSIVFAVLAAISQFISSYIMFKKTQPANQESLKKEGEENIAKVFSKQMIYIMPVFTLMIGLQFPGALVFYWFVMTVFNIFEINLIYNRFLKD